MDKLKAMWLRAKIQLAKLFGGTEEWLIGVGPLPTAWYWLAAGALVLLILVSVGTLFDRDPSVAETVLQPVAVERPEVVCPTLPAAGPAVTAPKVAKAKSYRSPVSQVQSDDAALPPEPEEIVWQAPPTPVTRESVDQFRATLRKE